MRQSLRILATQRPAAAASPLRVVVALLAVLLLLTCLAAWTGGCTSEEATDGSTTSTGEDAQPSGDIDGAVGEAIEVGAAVVTVRALQETFHPATPEQRMSEQTPVGSGER